MSRPPVTVTQPPVTVTQPATVTQATTLTQPTTIFQTTTVISVSPTTATVSRTVTSVDLSTITDTVSTTVVRTTTNVVSTCPSGSSSLSGLVTCTSRIINPTYTPPAPLPTNYLWGCPPGTICTPPQIGCNWEQNPPNETYVCAPSECKPVPPLPTISNYNSTWPNPDQPTCAWDNPVLGYFHLNPEFFGLTFQIFNVFGQPVCPAATVTTTVGWVDWMKPKPTSPPQMARRAIGSNPLAQLARRQSLAVAPHVCYAVFDAANLVAQNTGYVYDQLCVSGSSFETAVASCRACASANGATSGTVDSFPALQQYQNWCDTHAPS